MNIEHQPHTVNEFRDFEIDDNDRKTEKNVRF